MTHAITFSSEGVWTNVLWFFDSCGWKFLNSVLMGSILVSCQSEFILRLKLRTRRLNVLEVHGIKASVKIHRWTNKETIIISAGK